MAYSRILWDDPNDLQGNVQHVADHGLDTEDVEEVLCRPVAEGVSASSGLAVVWGYTPENVYINVVFEQVEEDTVRVVTAYQVPEPREGK